MKLRLYGNNIPRFPSAIGEALHITMPDGVTLNVLHWKPEQPSHLPPILFVPGLISAITGWIPLLQEMVREAEVFYVETREKKSAGLPERKMVAADFSVACMARDLVATVESLEISPASFIGFGSSFGATVILEAMKEGKLPLREAFLVGPNSHYHGPWYMRALLLLHPSLYHFAKYVIIWFLRHRGVDRKAEPEQMERYYQTIMGAEPFRLKLTAKAALGFTLWPKLETIGAPVKIAYAESDTLHSRTEIEKMVTVLPNAQLVPCASNKFMHSACLWETIKSQLSRV